jgi:hypothetical protein
MAFSFNDPIVQLGLFICAYIIVTGVCSYFGYSSDQYGIYMAFTAFILSVVMILPDPIQIGNNSNILNSLSIKAPSRDDVGDTQPIINLIDSNGSLLNSLSPNNN